MQQEEKHQPGFLAQVYLLMWRIMLVHWRNKKMTFMEVILPISGALFWVFLRKVSEPNYVNTPTIFPMRNLSMKAAGNIIMTNQNQAFVLYAPNTTLVKSLITEVYKMYREDNMTATFLGFASESDLEEYYKEDFNRTNFIQLALVFDVTDSVSAWPAKVTYKIRPKTGRLKWDTDSIFGLDQDFKPREIPQDMYYEEGFLYLQKSVDLAIIKTWQPTPSVNTSDWFVNRMTFPPYIDDPMSGWVKVFFSLIIFFSFMMSAAVMTKSVVYDKEKQLKQGASTTYGRNLGLEHSVVLDLTTRLPEGLLFHVFYNFSGIPLLDEVCRPQGPSDQEMSCSLPHRVL